MLYNVGSSGIRPAPIPPKERAEIIAYPKTIPFRDTILCYGDHSMVSQEGELGRPPCADLASVDRDYVLTLIFG